MIFKYHKVENLMNYLVYMNFEKSFIIHGFNFTAKKTPAVKTGVSEIILL